ncbi:MAG: uncharacterized protein QOD98_933 [Nocardioidaceae bacterium]|nr:uncharacterized protein [Nocardioidaceae bacterium]
MASEPVRTCIGCRAQVAKRELVRVTVGSDPHGRLAVVPDPQGTAPGRGAHLHPTAECYELAVRKKAFGRALRISGGGASGMPDSVAVSSYITARDQTEQTEDREEGWSSGS